MACHIGTEQIQKCKLNSKHRLLQLDENNLKFTYVTQQTTNEPRKHHPGANIFTRGLSSQNLDDNNSLCHNIGCEDKVLRVRPLLIASNLCIPVTPFFMFGTPAKTHVDHVNWSATEANKKFELQLIFDAFGHAHCTCNHLQQE